MHFSFMRFTPHAAAAAGEYFCWMHQMLMVLPILLQCLSLGTASNCGFAKSPLPFLNTNGWHAYLCYLAIGFVNGCV